MGRVLTDHSRLGLLGGVVLTAVLAGLVALEVEAALGLSLLRYGMQVGTLTPAVLTELRSGVVFGLPGLVVGIGVGCVHHRRTAGPPSRPSQATVVALLTLVPTLLTLVLGLAGFALVVGSTAVEHGIAASLTIGVFFGALVFAVALGGATIMLLVIGVTAGVGVAVGERICETLAD